VAFNDAKDTLKIMYEKQSNCWGLKKKDGGKSFIFNQLLFRVVFKQTALKIR